MGAVLGHIAQETPKHEVVEKTPQFEIRQYGPLIVAEAAFQGKRGERKGSGEAFWALAGYIGVLSAPKNLKPGGAGDGASPSSEAIPMTAPVIMQDVGEKIAMTASVIMEGKEGESAAPSMTMQFVLPSKYTIDTVPKPTDPKVTVKEVPGRRVGATVFSGSQAEEYVREKAKELKEALEAAGYKTKGTFVSAFYNDPSTLPWFRTNEVWFELES